MKVYLIRAAAFLIFLLLFAGGYWIVGRSSRTSAIRNPAAIPKTPLFDFSALEDNALDRASRRRILQGAQTLAEQTRVGITLGHFLTRTKDGTSVAACDIYEKIQLVFEAEGMATSGDRPKLTIEAPCRASDDLASTKPIWIPVDKILQSPPANGEYSYLEDATVSVKFEHMDFAWPRHWVLSRVHFESTRDGELFIERKEIYENSKVPLTMFWPEKVNR